MSTVPHFSRCTHTTATTEEERTDELDRTLYGLLLRGEFTTVSRILDSVDVRNTCTRHLIVVANVTRWCQSMIPTWAAFYRDCWNEVARREPEAVGELLSKYRPRF